MYGKDGTILIGVITANASQSEQRQLLEGITSQAEKLGAVTAVFTNIYNSAEYFAEVEVENRIYDLIISEKIDGLILTAESFLNPDIQQYIAERISARSPVPVVATGAVLPQFICVDNDVCKDLEEITDHLIEEHGFTDIDLLTGHQQMETSQQRLEGYRRSLAAHGIPYKESNVIYGDFWMTSGEKLAAEYMEGKRRLPQAVICANDYMAYGLCDAFLSGGISMPEDVTVMGYEYVGERYYHAPILTTYQRNRRAVGAQAVNLLWERITGFSPEPLKLTGCVIKGDTCPCGTDRQQLDAELQTIRHEQFYSKLNLVGNFEQQLTLCRSIADYVDVLQQFAYMIRDIVGLHLCLYENWCSTEISGGYAQDTRAMVYYRIISNVNSTDEPVFYEKYDLFPEELTASDSGDILYFCPLFFSGRELGYIIVQFDHPDCYDIIFRDWLKIAANALEFLRMKNDIGTLLECRNLSEVHDSITGLYNREGLFQELDRLKKKPQTEDSILFLLLRTELFFDSSSLDSQELSVRMDMELAENLKRLASPRDTFCAKLSGKLYAFAAAGRYTDAQRMLLTDKLSTLIRHAPLYSEYCDCDSLVVCGSLRTLADCQPEAVLAELEEQLHQEIAELTQKHRHPLYKEYRALRTSLWRSPAENWDADRVCRKFRLSAGHFRAVYKELSGLSFHQDVIRSRISLAKHLLMTTALSLPAVAGKCGYEDDKYFLRQFRQITGMSPNQYRSSQLGQEQEGIL